MTERLEQVEARLASVQQLDGIVTAIRNLASTRVRHAKLALPGIRTYAAAIGEAISQALALDSAAEASPTRGGSRRAIILFGSEQGFVGSLNETLLLEVMPQGKPHDIVVAGRRLFEACAERGIQAQQQFALPTQPSGATAMALDMADWIYAQVAKGSLSELDLVFPVMGTGGVAKPQRRRLLPFDFTRFRTPSTVMPVVNLDPVALLQQLAGEYVFSEICEAAIQTILTENEVRVASMAAARENIEETGVELRRLAHALQQEMITNEVIELSVGVAASRAR